MWLALFIGICLLLPNTPPRAITLIYVALMVVTLALGLRYRMGLVAIAVIMVAGIGMRVALFGVAYSDVLRVTQAAIQLVLAGGNPYGVGFDVSTPPGSPFAYGPLTLLWYLPFKDPRFAEMISAGVILIALAVRGRPLGLALYALTPVLLTTASDGSNDTSAGLFLLVALVVATRAPRAGAFLLAVSVAFKPYAAAWLPALWAWAGSGALLAFLAGSALTWGPALLFWGVGNLVGSFVLAERVHQRTSYFSLGYVLETMARRKQSAEMIGYIRLLIGGLVTLVTVRIAHSAAAMIITGTLVYLATLYTGYWSTHAYLAAIAPILCWHLDEWLGLAHEWVILPGDPAGRIGAALDRRWPLIEGRARDRRLAPGRRAERSATGERRNDPEKVV